MKNSCQNKISEWDLKVTSRLLQLRRFLLWCLLSYKLLNACALEIECNLLLVWDISGKADVDELVSER